MGLEIVAKQARDEISVSISYEYSEQMKKILI